MAWSAYYVLRSPAPLTAAQEAALREHGRSWSERLSEDCDGYAYDAGDAFDDDDTELPPGTDVRSGCTKVGDEDSDTASADMIQIFEAVEELAGMFPTTELFVSDDRAYPDRTAAKDLGDFRAKVKALE